MTATERLRQLLDERGVEWMGTIHTKSTHGHPTNTSLDEEYHNAVFIEYVDGSVLRLFNLTPEQAIDATLGRGTCRMELPDLRGPAYTDVYVCSECGGEVMVGTVMGVSDVPKWCPWCGRKVES